MSAGSAQSLPRLIILRRNRHFCARWCSLSAGVVGCTKIKQKQTKNIFLKGGSVIPPRCLSVLSCLQPPRCLSLASRCLPDDPMILLQDASKVPPMCLSVASSISRCKVHSPGFLFNGSVSMRFTFLIPHPRCPLQDFIFRSPLKDSSSRKQLLGVLRWGHK